MIGKELQILNIYGERFEVNVRANALVEKDNPLNIIDLSKADYEDGKYSFLYSALTKNTAKFPDPGILVFNVEIPSLCQLDPQGFAEHFNVSSENLNLLKDDEAVLLQPSVVERIAGGKLPQLQIGDDIYYVDFRMQMLRPKDDFLSKGISFYDLENSYYTENATGFLHIVSIDNHKHEIAFLDPLSKSTVPDEIVFALIPSTTELDPVGHARTGGWNVGESLIGKPYSGTQIAKELDWQNVKKIFGLSEAVKPKRFQNITDNSQNTDRQSPTRSKKPKKGRRL